MDKILCQAKNKRIEIGKIKDMIDRAAIDTIKGYFYQFDYTIVKLLELQKGADTIIVEGIEDVDVTTATEQTSIQCKYYSKTE